MNWLSFAVLVMLFAFTHQEAPLSYTLISNISVSLASTTYVKSNSMYYVCTGQILNVYHILTGVFAYSVNFNSIASGSTLQCYDAFEDNSFCLFNKGTSIIRFKGDTQTYDYYDNLITKTKGKLLLDGSVSVTNYPSAAKLYILNHTTNVSLLLTPDGAVSTADYSISVNLTRSIFSVFQTRKMFTYSYIASSWSLLTSLSLTPLIGSNVYFMSYSPNGNYVYHSKGTSTLNIRYSNNLTLITSITYSGLNVVNVQFMNTLGDEIYILFWNSTSGLYTGQIYNTTTSTVTSNIVLTTTLKSIDIFADNLTKIVTYSSYIQVWKMTCPFDSVYVSQYGNCFYCNQTDLCPVFKNSASFTQIQQSIIQMTTKFYSFPTIRSTFKSFSYAFLAMDNLWMYYYHNRTYGSKTVEVFTAIQRIQNLKFAFLTVIEALYQALTDTQLIIHTISDYSLYTASNFYAIQQNDGSFLSNCLDYLIYQIPFTILIFYLVRKIFFALFNYKISKYLRLYSFWGYCLISVLQPNIQYFFFLLTNQFRLTFSFSCKTKFLNLIWIISIFFVVVLSTLLAFYMRYLYVKKASLFMDGVFNQKMGLFWICFNTTIKRMCTGFIHSYFVNEPLQQIIYLVGIQTVSIFIIFLFWKKAKIFKQSLFACMNILFGLVFIGFQGTLFVNSFVNQTDQLAIQMMDNVIYFSVLSIFLTAFIFGILSLIPFSACKSNKQNQKEQVKQKNQNKTIFKISFAGVQNINKSIKTCLVSQNKNDFTTKQQQIISGVQLQQKVKSNITLIGKSTKLSILTYQNKGQVNNQQFGDSQMQMVRKDQKPKVSIANIKNLNYKNIKKQKQSTLPIRRFIKTYKTKIPQKKNEIATLVNQKQAKSSIHLQEQIDVNKLREPRQPIKKTLKSIRFIQQVSQYPENDVTIKDNIFNFDTHKSIQASTHKMKSSKKIKDDVLVFTEKQIQT